jgi:Dockerin type I domain/Cohesin domain
MKYSLLLLPLLFAVSYGQTPAVQIGFQSGVGATEGASGVIGITIASVPGSEPAAVQFSLSYPSDVGGVSVSAGPAATAASKEIACNTANPMLCVIYGVNQNRVLGSSAAPGTLASVAFSVAKTAALSETVTLSGVVAADPSGNAIASAGSAGTITVFSVYDLNRDGKIDAQDLQIIINAILGQTAQDLNGDGKTDVLDLMVEALAALGILH